MAEALRANFGVDLGSLQIPLVSFSATFAESNALAVTAETQAVREENQRKVVGYIADQRACEAQGQRDAVADGRRGQGAARPGRRRPSGHLASKHGRCGSAQRR